MLTVQGSLSCIQHLHPPARSTTRLLTTHPTWPTQCHVRPHRISKWRQVKLITELPTPSKWRWTWAQCKALTEHPVSFLPSLIHLCLDLLFFQTLLSFYWLLIIDSFGLPVSFCLPISWPYQFDHVFCLLFCTFACFNKLYHFCKYISSCLVFLTELTGQQQKLENV